MVESASTNGPGFNGLAVIYEIAKILSAGGELQRIMEDILAVLETHAGMNRGTITILKPGNTELAIDASRGIPVAEKAKVTYRLGEGITGKVVESGKPVAIHRLSDEPHFLDKTGMRQNLRKSDLSFMCVPIKADSQTVGALSVDRVGIENETGLENELRFLEAIADLIAQLVLARRRRSKWIEHLEEENIKLRKTLEELEERGKSDLIVGNSGSMRDMYRQIAQVAPSPTTVLLRGETGTGKELVARAIHDKSPRRDSPFITVNCAALPESLLESELFGHEKGSFTGATTKRIGRFEAAHQGTLFLDEIGEMSPSAQSRLLRAIQEKEIQRVGSTESIRIDVRLVCATNRDLETDVSVGKFREDLYYRVNVFTIFLPPLRERGADILLLADHFVRKYTNIHGKPIERLSTPTIDMLASYHWPGNVRELENVLERAVIVATGNVIEGHDLPPSLQIKDAEEATHRRGTFESLVAAYEKELITDALKDSRGNQTEAARLLGTTKRVVQYKVKRYGIDYLRFKRH